MKGDKRKAAGGCDAAIARKIGEKSKTGCKKMVSTRPLSHVILILKKVCLKKKNPRREFWDVVFLSVLHILQNRKANSIIVRPVSINECAELAPTRNCD